MVHTGIQFAFLLYQLTQPKPTICSFKKKKCCLMVKVVQIALLLLFNETRDGE